MENKFMLSVGMSSFTEIRKNNYYYIDKTGLIQDLLEKDFASVTLITRPRRFGKTLAMSMLSAFFDIQQDNRQLFDGLVIMQNQRLCELWMNQYPVLFLSLKGIDGLNFENAYANLAALLAQLYIEHLFLIEDESITIYEKQVFERIAGKKASLEEIQNSLAFLMRLMQRHYQKPVILLLDEYDVPIAKADVKGYYDRMLEVIGAMLGSSLKDNPSLKMGVITGCLRISKESIFTGTNNFVTDTISDSRYNEYFGFTHQEMKQLLADTNCEEYAEQIQKWYDGYHFGNLDIYCPWDVLNYIQKIKSTGITKPENFWEHTSDNAIIKSFLERTDFDVTEKFEALLNGDTISEAIEENLTYNVLTSSEQNIWSLLYLTGYLTKEQAVTDSKETRLKIPNAEVAEIFRKNVDEWQAQKMIQSDRHQLFEALWNADTKALTAMLSDLLFNTISYHDYAESYYHAFVTGLFSASGYIVESNYENGLGRSDVVIKDRHKRSAVVIEMKISESIERMPVDCQKALEQIEEKKYAQKLINDGFRTVIRYGIAFYKKECLVEKKLYE